VIFTKLKTTIMVAIFLLLLILNIPEFIVCMSAVPDEIMDIPCLLVKTGASYYGTNTEKLLRTIFEIVEADYRPPQKRKLTGFGVLSDISYAAGIRRQYLYRGDISQYEDSKKIDFIGKINRPTLSIKRSSQIFSTLHTPVLSVIRI